MDLAEDRLGFTQMLKNSQHDDVLEAFAAQGESLSDVRTNQRPAQRSVREELVVQADPPLDDAARVAEKTGIEPAADITEARSSPDMRQNHAIAAPGDESVKSGVGPSAICSRSSGGLLPAGIILPLTPPPERLRAPCDSSPPRKICDP